MSSKEESNTLLENDAIPEIGVTEASPNHVNPDIFFTTALLAHLASERKSNQGFQPSISGDNYSITSYSTSNNHLLPPIRRNKHSTRTKQFSESSNVSTIIYQRKIVKRCRFLGLDMCCTPKYGWIIGYGILIWVLLLVGCQQFFKGEKLPENSYNRVFSLSIFFQIITSSLLFYGIAKRNASYFIPSLVMNCYEILAHLVIMFSLSLCYYGNFNTTKFLRNFKWFSVYGFDTQDLWPTEEQKLNFLKFEITTTKKNQCNVYEAFLQFAVEMLVIVLYVGLTYGLNNYRLRLIARQSKKSIEKTQGKSGEDAVFV